MLRKKRFIVFGALIATAMVAFGMVIWIQYIPPEQIQKDQVHFCDSICGEVTAVQKGVRGSIRLFTSDMSFHPWEMALSRSKGCGCFFERDSEVGDSIYKASSSWILVQKRKDGTICKYEILHESDPICD